MARGRPPREQSNNGTAANLGFEATLWAVAERFRSNKDVAEYKHIGLGLGFFRCNSDAFEEQHAQQFVERHLGDPFRNGRLSDFKADFIPCLRNVPQYVRQTNPPLPFGAHP